MPRARWEASLMRSQKKAQVQRWQCRKVTITEPNGPSDPPDDPPDPPGQPPGFPPSLRGSTYDDTMSQSSITSAEIWWVSRREADKIFVGPWPEVPDVESWKSDVMKSVVGCQVARLKEHLRSYLHGCTGYSCQLWGSNPCALARSGSCVHPLNQSGKLTAARRR